MRRGASFEKGERMRENEVMEQLAALGTEQTRKTYRRHGATGEVLGVLYSELRKLQKRCGIDQALADALWATGIHDARVLATLVADPAAMTDAKLEEWVGQVDNYPLGDAVAELAAKAPGAVERMKAWIATGREWVTAAGWQVVTILASRGNGELEDSAYADYLAQIERTIHSSPNRVRHSMNGALIAIGLRNPDLQAKALAAAERIGKVVVDHGQTNCKTPDAISYIRRAVLRRSDKTNSEKTVTANEEPEMTETMNQSSITKRSSNNEPAPKTSTKRTAADKPAAKKASKRAGAKKAAKKASKRAGAKPAAAKKASKRGAAKPAAAKKASKRGAAKPAAAKKASKRGAAKPAAAKKASKRGAAKPAAAKKASKRGAAKPAAAKKASKRAGANGAAPKKASKRAASKGTSRKQPAPTTATPPATA
jgi:3-methyladenine DNA glycosylase AlkD